MHLIENLTLWAVRRVDGGVDGGKLAGWRVGGK